MIKDINNLKNDKQVIKLMTIAADIKKRGFGIGEIHLRVNATQIRNAMRPVDGKAISISNFKLQVGSNGTIIKTNFKEKPWKINFKNIELESATARRQLVHQSKYLNT